MTSDERIAAFRALHEADCFVLPNPWDAGSAVLLAALGFRALATTSAGLAFSLARPDNPTSLTLEDTLDNVRRIVEATDLPVNADFQGGYGATPDDVAESVRRCVETGVAGLSIEDAHGERELFELPEAVERVRAARAAIDASGRKVVLTARAECFLIGTPHPLADAVERLTAYAEAGADCLFAPGLRTRAEVARVVEAVAPKPVNVLVRDPSWMTAEALAELGVRRISVGSALARVAWKSVHEAAADIAGTGSFRSLTDAETFAALNRRFSTRP